MIEGTYITTVRQWGEEKLWIVTQYDSLKDYQSKNHSLVISPVSDSELTKYIDETAVEGLVERRETLTNSPTYQKLIKGHKGRCDTSEGGSCDCGYESWLYQTAEKYALSELDK